MRVMPLTDHWAAVNMSSLGILRSLDPRRKRFISRWVWKKANGVVL